MTTTPETMIYKGFKFSFNDPAEKEQHMKTVDDYENEQQSIPMDVDAARVALAHMTACRMIKPMSVDQATQLKTITLGLDVGSVVPALAPNRIEARHFTKSSRVRNFVHGGMLGVLAVRLLNDTSTSIKRSSRTWDSWRILRRVNGQAGCEHVMWSIPEFQCRYNISIAHFKSTKNPFEHMSIDDTTARLNAMNTPENRQKFIDDCNALANDVNHSRVKCITERRTLANEWIAEYMSAFTKVCLHKMSVIGNNSSNNSMTMIDRAKHVVELFRLISSNIEWVLMDCNLRFVCRLDRLWTKYLERLVHMSQEGIEHSACILMRCFPEMMTPELHVLVNPREPVYRVPELQIADDDALFGPLKLACQGLLPDAVVPNPNPVRTRAFYESDDEFDCDCDYEDEGDYSDDDEDDEDEDEDDAQG